MNSLIDSLYNKYSAKEMENELWKFSYYACRVQEVYGGLFPGHKTDNSTIVVISVCEIQVILHKIHTKSMNLSEIL